VFTAQIRASVKLFELGVRTPGGLFLGVWYGLEIFKKFHEIFKYFKVKYFIVHL